MSDEKKKTTHTSPALSLGGRGEDAAPNLEGNSKDVVYNQWMSNTMSPYPAEFLEQIEEGWKAPFSGWDFSWLKGKYTEAEPSWDYREMARERIAEARALLDMDTGGGELLAGLAPLPPMTWATETWEPNIPVAKARLEPLGGGVVPPADDHHLPFEDATFDLVLNRHGSFDPDELMRVLRPGGRLLTQQVGGRNQVHLNEVLQGPAYEYGNWTLEGARQGLAEAGFEILRAREEFPETQFLSIGGLVYYLRVISWQVPGFTPQAYLERLYGVYEQIRRDGRLVSHEHRFLIEARRP